MIKGGKIIFIFKSTVLDSPGFMIIVFGIENIICFRSACIIGSKILFLQSSGSFKMYFITGISLWVSELPTTALCQFFIFVFRGPPGLYGHTNSGWCSLGLTKLGHLLQTP